MNSIDAHFRLRYKITKYKLKEILKEISKLKMLKQSINKQNEDIDWDTILSENSIKKRTIVV